MIGTQLIKNPTKLTSGQARVATVKFTKLSGIGSNLIGIADWSLPLQIPFLDLFKSSRPWVWQKPYTTITTNVDENGWLTSVTPPSDVSPRSIPGTFLFTSAKNYPAGKYIVLYDGEGTLNYKIAARKDNTLSTPGRDVIDVNPNVAGGISLQITSTDPNNTANYIRNIRIVRAEDETNYTNLYDGQTFDPSTAKIFNPSFLDQIKKLETVRFMDWGRTNGSPLVNWSDRPTLAQAQWTTSKGVPIEVMVALANQASVNPWFNIPHMATDDYVRNFAQYVKNNLTPGKKVYLEYTNEAWNWMFPQTTWIETQARAQSPKLNYIQWYALRSAQVINIWRDVFGPQSNQIVGVLGGQSGYANIASMAINYLKRTNNLSTINAVAIAPYFGRYIGSPRYESQVQNLTLDDIFTEITQGGVIKDTQGNPVMPGGALRRAYVGIKDHAALTQRNNLQLIASEGGQNMTGFGGVEKNKTILNLFKAANRDPRMGQIYQQYLTRWYQLGGGSFLNFDVFTSPQISNWIQSPKNSAIGSNLDPINNWSSQSPFIDAFKSYASWRWESYNTTLAPNSANSLNPIVTAPNLDQNGWITDLTPPPTVLSDARPSISLFNNLDNYPSGEYAVLYDGEGTIEYRFAASKNTDASSPGRDVINISPNMGDGVSLQITDTDPNKTGNYIRNIRIIPLINGIEQPYTDWYNQQPFNPDTARVFNSSFLDSLQPFQTLRFMNWMNTNKSLEVNWSDRPTLNQAQWLNNKGVPVEILVALTNQTSTNPWFSMPSMVNDDYVRNFAQYVKDNLAPNRKIYVEYSNEAWNASLPQFQWIKAQAAADGLNTTQWFAKRTAQVINIWRDVFGAQSGQIVGVLGAQAANSSVANTEINYLKATNNLATINALAIAPYFGAYLTEPKYIPQTQNMTLDNFFDELTKGGVITNSQGNPSVPSGALEQSYRRMQANASLAGENNLQLIAYNGGQHPNLAGVKDNQAITDLFTAANNDPRMLDIYEQYLYRWNQLGGNLFVNYDLPISSTSGNWMTTASSNLSNTITAAGTTI
ncbi:MAG: hypothetical protein N5P05_000362 [Chroococcopsis gigantea SAG 12.99]|jgi:hypothetical protein|nr:hypothetical protein [Chroococcopsis gigantea SAG 12.99]